MLYVAGLALMGVIYSLNKEDVDHVFNVIAEIIKNGRGKGD